MFQPASAREIDSPTPPPEITCNVAPRTLSEILSLADRPDAALPERGFPTGEPADPFTTAAIAAVLGELGTCLTAGEMLRFYGLHNGEWLQRSLDLEGLATLETSTPPLADGQRAVYVGPWHVQILADGRVLAAVLLRIDNELRPAPERTRVMLFVNRNRHWIVDETIDSVQLADCEVPVQVAAVVGPPPGALFDSWSASCIEQSP